MRAENIRLGERGPSNVFSGRIIERRYQGMQTLYDLEVGGQRLEALELGTAARHSDGEIALTLPPETCWAYRDEGGDRRLIAQSSELEAVHCWERGPPERVIISKSEAFLPSEAGEVAPLYGVGGVISAITAAHAPSVRLRAFTGT